MAKNLQEISDLIDINGNLWKHGYALTVLIGKEVTL